MTESTIEQGARVRLTIKAGIVAGKEGAGFVATAPEGTVGTYAGPHPSPSLREWHLIEVDRGDVIDEEGVLDEELAGRSVNIRLYAPVHRSQFESAGRRSREAQDV